MKKILYSIIALVASFAMPSSVMADDGETIDVQYLVVLQDDGTQSKFALKDYPEITHEQDSLVVTTSDRTIKFDFAGLTNYSFTTEQEPIPTAIGSVQQNGSTAPAFSYGNAEFSGLKSGAAVSAYSINGQKIMTIKANADGVAKIDLSSLPKGVIILRTPTKSIKIINK